MKFESILKWIGVSLLCVYFVGWGSCYRSSEKDSRQIAVERSIDDTSTTHTITITKKRSPEILINSGKFLVEPVGDNVPFICHYNGGEGNGGWDDIIPARKDFEKENFKPKFHPKKGVTVSFTLQSNAPIESARIIYSIEKM